MFEPIQTAPLTFNIFIAILLSIIYVSNSTLGALIQENELFDGQEKVEELVREWAPLVWLAPNEKFMPGDVTEFLQHVHAEKGKFKSSSATVTSAAATAEAAKETSAIYDDEQIHYYNADNEFSPLLGQDPVTTWERRNKRMFNYIIDLPLGDYSSDWHLVTNDAIDDLLADSTSFIYGQSPNTGSVPIYAMVKLCNTTVFEDQQPQQQDNDFQLNLIDSRNDYRRSTYIPVSNPMLQNSVWNKASSVTPESKSNGNQLPNLTLTRDKRELLSPVNEANATDAPITTTAVNLPDEIVSTVEIQKENSTDDAVGDVAPISTAETVTTQSTRTEQSYPHFHVTYWMFYPYSQGKAICTLSLGPLGNLPIPQFFGICLGTKKDFGSHVGDWEHMTLYFNGQAEPSEMYVSAHDAGAYYAYERLTGTFDFRRQESRKGILQHPNFPRTVITSKNHPVLFSAQGSHGLWTAPGKHRFVRVARLFDVNGFGTAWPTWKRVEVSYESDRSKRSAGPEWLQYNGRWGNQRSKCHPLKGLNFCEYTDGPTGIPAKPPHFYCSK